MNNINNTLKNEMSVVSSLILDEAKNGKKIHLVTVDERKDSSAFTDGSSVIQVPVNFGNVTPQLRSVAYGFLSHEASHCRNTDFTVIRKLVETYGGLAHRLQNVIEDPRIERIAVLQFPGQRQHLNTTKEHVIAQGWWAGPNPQGICWQECLLSYALYWGNVCVGFACAEPLMQAWENIFNDIFSHYCGKDAPDFIREQIKTAVLADQADATALAVEKILDLILANKDKFRKDLQNLPEESRTTSNSYDLKGLYDEEDQQQSTGNGNSGTGTNGSNAEGESTAEGNGSGAESEDAEGSNADSDGSESAEEDADSNGTETAIMPTVPDLKPKLTVVILTVTVKALKLTVNLKLTLKVKMQKAIMPEVSDLKVLKVTVLPMKQTVTVAIPKPMLMKLTVKALNLKVIVPTVKMPLTVNPAVLQVVHLPLVVCLLIRARHSRKLSMPCKRRLRSCRLTRRLTRLKILCRLLQLVVVTTTK